MENASALWKKYQAGLCTEEERLLLENWFHHLGKDSQTNLSEEDFLELQGEMWQEIDSIAPEKKTHRLWPRIAAAASILLCCSIGLYYFYQHKTKPEATQIAKNDIAPGSNKAILTLANGKKIILNDAKDGTIAQQGQTTVSKTADGQLVYNHQAVASLANTATEIAYNLLEVPRGGQHQLTLSDGTKVWLNAASTIRYPATFTGNERRVEITGEAYFEVVHNDKMPFRVSVEGQTIEDLGTHFNINSYADEPAIRTTLLEGSVKVSTGVEMALLKPGQQAQISPHASKISILNDVDMDDAIAWKNGMFRFSDENLESVMRKVSRWYDVDIAYTNNEVKALPMTGIITHFTNVSKVLRMLELTRQVHFKIEEKKIIVIK